MKELYCTDRAGISQEKVVAMCEELQAQQQALALHMETLRAEGREKSVKFRELFAQKLTNGAFLSILQAKGLL